MLDIASLYRASSPKTADAAGGNSAMKALEGARNLKGKKDEDPALRKAFDGFVGETFYGQMLSSMRKTVGKPAYMHGGRAEEIFRGQLDQQLAEEMTKATANSFTGPMFDLFMMNRK
jgi:Rod binding domain-containing protein